MKGITSHVMVIIFSLIIMVVLLVIGIGFVQNYTNIPFEKLWELTPNSGIATEPGYEGGGGGKPISSIITPRFFTTSGPYDLSEIACLIGTDIFDDFSKNGDQSSRAGSYIYCGAGPCREYLVDQGIFLYSNTQYSAAGYGTSSSGYITGTDTNRLDSVFGTAGGPNYAACHICRKPEVKGTLLSVSVPKVGGIKDLDENCINMQLRDRMVGTASVPNFCSGTFNAGGTDYKFGNSNPFDIDETRNNDLIKAAIDPSNWKTVNFCDNGKDLVYWIATDNQYGVNWEVVENGWGGSPNVKLVDGNKYIYSVYWMSSPGGASDKRYKIEFDMIPNENNITTFSDFNIIKDNDYFTNYPRTNLEGWGFKELRTEAVFNVNLANPLLISDLRTTIGSGDKTKVVCTSCNNLNQPEPTVHASGDHVAEQIILWTNATDSGRAIDVNGNLPSGPYRVYVRNYYNIYAAYDDSALDNKNKESEKSVVIYPITKCSDIGSNAACNSAIQCNLFHMHIYPNPFECSATGNICCY